MATNLTSVFFACTEIGRHMLQRGSGSIVNIASVAAHRGSIGSAGLFVRCYFLQNSRA